MIAQRLEQYGRFGIHLGLERIQSLLAALENPQLQVPVVHVAGTNGKGSVCAYVASILTEAGYRVGRYTSPHLVSWCERICINNQAIAPADLDRTLAQVESAIAAHDETPTQFEVFTAAAWLYFAQQSVDIAVIEVGLGGRLDATNVVDQPLVTAIVSLSREHWQRLGPTLADIAREKAGILKSHRPAVIGPLPDEAEAVVLARAIALDCPIIRPQPAELSREGFAIYSSNSPQHSTIRYSLPLPGRHQLTNSAIAIAAVHSLREQGWQVSDQAMIDGIARARWRGRLQWLRWHAPDKNQFVWLVDGAHNPAAATVLRDYVDAIAQPNLSVALHQSLDQWGLSVPLQGPTTWLMGMLTTKDHADVFEALLKPGDRLHLVPVPDHSSMTPIALREIALRVCPELAACTTYENLDTALQVATLDRTPLKVLCGSLYLVGHFFHTQTVDEG
ncbi:bifunctional folylpolyglutamate synthase/dihydrofolate synthase [Oscillatoria sp. CS-180]|uniref:bifunctional folylpolyglutamate synthase/dihydrofolate synthase n=1 Tax=Oscillatoria sp. CS-180 TaxID=3021720 RepID=UPI00232EE792|nr:folylpolyglutamate synthase/dihydrofolate synthase family protein [Oscillatoria sp. CS-180]MDB9527079.1 bifunctional folylpolyglutamate synthase/dihydrofolate synthase [Oscillatoria sp. CS-180]